MNNNYRIIKLPDCCAVCKYYDNDFYCGPLCNKNKPISWMTTKTNGICDDFERITYETNKP